MPDIEFELVNNDIEVIDGALHYWIPDPISESGATRKLTLPVKRGFKESVDYHTELLARLNDPNQRSYASSFKKFIGFEARDNHTIEKYLYEIKQSIGAYNIADLIYNVYLHGMIVKHAKKLEQDKHRIENNTFDQILQDAGIKPDPIKMWWWVTLNFAPETDMLELPALAARICDLKAVEKATYVFEYHTGGDNHPHIHMKLGLNKDKKTWSKSDLIDKLYKNKWLSKHMSDKAKLDVRPFLKAEHNAYLVGDKTEHKMESCESDYELRESLGLPHIVEYSK